MRVEYPILTNDSSESDKNKLISKLYGHTNRYGFFPLGRLNNWHGGVHLEDIKDVRAIADGVIVAYRISEDYVKSGDEEYSNNFLLVRHEYKSPNGQEFYFFSLYMHLMPLKKISKKPLPDFLTENIHKVKKRQYIRGLFMKDAKGNYIKENNVKVVLPFDKLLEKPKDKASMDEFENSIYKKPVKKWHKNLEKYHYRPIKYNGKTCYIATAGNRVKNKRYTRPFKINDKYQINTIEDTNYKNKRKDYEIPVYGLKSNTNNFIVGKINAKEFYPSKYKLKNIDSVWAKVVLDGSTGYIRKDTYTTEKKLKRTFMLSDSRVELANIPIKATELIGYPSKYNLENDKSYNAVHMEVMSDDKRITDFLSNNLKDENDVYFVTKGLSLNRKPCNLEKNSKAKFIEKKGDYVKIGFEDIEKEVSKEYLDFTKKDKSNQFTSTLNFDELNKLFLNALTNSVKGDTRLFSTIDKAIIKDENKDCQKVKFSPIYSSENFWVKASNFKASDINNTECFGEWISVQKDIGYYYSKCPVKGELDKTKSEYPIRVIKKDKGLRGEKWFKVKGLSLRSESSLFWVKEKELKNKNAFKWSDFGWEVIEDKENKYFYQFGSHVEEKKAPLFAKKVWDKLASYDEDENKLLDVFELRKAVSSKKGALSLSRLICKHRTEWNYGKADNWKLLEDEIQKYTKYGIDKATGKKQESLKKALEEKLVVINDKVRKLSFYNPSALNSDKEKKKKNDDKVSKLLKNSQLKEAVNARKEGKSTRRQIEMKELLPTDLDNIYHFHPIAFVEQMKMINPSNIMYIYFDGRVSKINRKEHDSITFVYVDRDATEYILCSCKLLLIDERLRGKEDDQKTSHTVQLGYDPNTIVTYSHSSNRKKYTYPDGTIRTYGKYDGKYRRVVYKKGLGKKYIVKMPKELNVKISDEKVIAYKFGATARTYCSVEVFAGFIGALGETGFSDIISNGMCEEDGTCFPSVTHNNGESVDIKYLKIGGGVTAYMYNKDFDKVRMQQLVNALKKFYFEYFAAWVDSEGKILVGTKKVGHHHHHLHAGNVNIKKIYE